MINKMHFWTWLTEEVKELLIWMKEYNQGKDPNEKIHFFGVDCQFFTYHADIINEIFNQTNVTLSEESIQFLNKIDQIPAHLIYDYYETMTELEKEEIDFQADQLLHQINLSSDEIKSVTTSYGYEYLQQLVMNIKQVNSFYYNYTHENTSERDYHMAQNALWASRLFGKENKVALWAHNMHLWNKSYSPINGTLGFYLKKEIQEDYQIVGFVFTFGSFTAYKQENNKYILGSNRILLPPLEDTFPFVFHYADYDNFILLEKDLLTNSSFDRWVSDRHTMFDIGASYIGNSYVCYHGVDFKENYDVFIYWDLTTASELLVYSLTNPNQIYCTKSMENLWI
jgi:erythromycin esterase